MKTHRVIYPLASLAVIFALLITVLPSKANHLLPAPPAAPKDPLQALQDQADGDVQISRHAETGLVSFISAAPDHPIAQKGLLAADAGPEAASQQFLSSYGNLFGLSQPSRELKVESTSTTEDGRSFVRFQQVTPSDDPSQGIPVMGAELIVQTDATQGVLSANGSALPLDVSQLDLTPSIVPTDAARTALQAVAAQYSVPTDTLAAAQPELWVYNPILLGGPQPRVTHLVWRVEVDAKALSPIRELVLVDAHLGRVVLHFNQVDTALYRKIYDNNNNKNLGLPGNGPVRSEGGPASSISDVNAAYDYAGATYNFYAWLGRDSLDGKGMQLVSTTRYCDPYSQCPFANAFWNGQQMVYGQGFASADDVVGHEMTHGVTEFTSKLYYYYQSGAINESLSDIMGEFIDQKDGVGNDSSSVKWLLGEDMPIGAIRSMSNPPAYGDPDSMLSNLYTCDLSEGDQGGVHTNSGVGNKAAFLMVDGGTFNGVNVTGIGVDKAAKIYYQAMTHYLISASDYADLSNALQRACTDLNASGATTAGDCAQVKNAVDAVKMSSQPPSCSAPEAPVCPNGTTYKDIFKDDLENPAANNWTSAATLGLKAFYYPQNANPYGYDATYATSGSYNIWADDLQDPSDSYIAMSKDITVPGSGSTYFRFNHAFGYDDTAPLRYYDGGVLEYSLDAGKTWLDAGSLITDNGYKGAIAAGYSNPLAGRQAFVAESNGYITTRVDLSSLAGKAVRFRFRQGTDSNNMHAGAQYDYGWFIDDLDFYNCQLPNRLVLSILVQREKSLPASGDAYVLQGNPNQNYGSAKEMKVGYETAITSTGPARSLIHFDVSSIPATAYVRSARLMVYLSSFQDLPAVNRLITTYQVNSSWTEGGVKWSNLPATGAAFGSAQIPNGTPGWYSFDVTNLVKGWVGGSITNNGVMLIGPETAADLAWRAFSTKEGANPPRLIVDYTNK